MKKTIGFFLMGVILIHLLAFENAYAFDSPLKQEKKGILWYNINCNDDLIVVHKEQYGPSACVHFETAKKLAERGWSDWVSSDLWHKWSKSIIQNFLENDLDEEYNIVKDSIVIGISMVEESYPPGIFFTGSFQTLTKSTDNNLKEKKLIWASTHGIEVKYIKIASWNEEIKITELPEPERTYTEGSFNQINNTKIQVIQEWYAKSKRVDLCFDQNYIQKEIDECIRNAHEYSTNELNNSLDRGS